MKSFLFCIFAFAAAVGFSDIQTIHSFKEAEEKILSLTPESLAIFDVDEVLVTPADAVLKPIGGKFNPDYLNDLSEKERDELLSVMLNGTEYVLVDLDAPAILEQLAKQKTNTIALTACRTGIFGVIPSMENWRCSQLNQVKIDLSASFFKGSECKFPESTGGKPIYKNGILFCGDFSSTKKSSKGELLNIFLNNMKWSPDEIVFFDDQMKNLLSVQEEAEKRGISFQGYLFEVPSSAALDEKIAELQFQTAIKGKRWLSDAQAKQQLEELIQIDDLSRLEKEIGALNGDSLVLFDIDFTLMIPKDEILRPQGQKLIKKLIAEVLENPSVVGKFPDGYLHSKILSTAQINAMDEGFAGLIKTLHEKKIPAIAFTGAPSGKLGVIEDLSDHKIEQLKTLGLDFSPAFPHVKPMKLTKKSEFEFSPAFKSGVLFASKHPKEEILKEFLAAIQWNPKKVVMIDNNIEKLRSVKKMLKEAETPFVGFHYTAAEKLPSALDESLAAFQFHYLAETGEWLSDEKAKSLFTASSPRQNAVVFDWGDVLASNSRESVVDFLSETFQLSPEEFEKTNHQKRLAMKSGQSDVGFWIWYAAQKNIDLPADWPAIYDEAIKKSIGANPEMFALIDELKGKKVQVALLSNIDDRYTGLIRKFGYYDPFEPCLLSCEIGLSKPDPQIYERLLQEIPLCPKEIVFIDDKEENIEAAKKMGIDAILFKSSGQIRCELTQRGLL